MTANSDTRADQATSKSTHGRSGADRTIAEQAGRVGEEVHELGRVAIAQAGEVAANLRERGQDALAAGREKLETSKGEFDRVVAAHPLKTVLIALGVGAVIGYALRRRA